MNVQPIPEGYHSVTPYLVTDDCARAIDFYKQVFGASELFRMPMPGGKIGHAEIRIGTSPVMLCDEMPSEGYHSAKALGNTAVPLMLYVEDVDAVFKRALAAGAIEMRAVANQFWGDRMGTLRDPFGHVWSIATHIEDVAPDEIERRAAAMHQDCGSA